jgi:hypothetical protein
MDHGPIVKYLLSETGRCAGQPGNDEIAGITVWALSWASRGGISGTLMHPPNSREVMKRMVSLCDMVFPFESLSINH